MSEAAKERILEILLESGPLSDGEIAPRIADQWEAKDVAPLTQELAADGLIEESAVAPNRWQITDRGRRRLGDEPGR